MTRTILFLAPAVALLAGCGKDDGDVPRATVKGVVLLDGQPLPVGLLTFQTPDNVHAWAMPIEANGTFSTDKVPAVKVKVAVDPQAVARYESIAPPALDPKTKAPARKALPKVVPVPAKYTNPATSGIEIDIPNVDRSNVKIELKSK